MPKTAARFPHTLTLLTGAILLAALLSYVLPAGEYQRAKDPVTEREVVVAGTYHRVPQQPVNLFQAAVGIPKGMVDAASIIFFVFLTGGAFTVIDQTGALREAVGSLVRMLRNREVLVIPIVCVFFAMGGVLENLQEEIIPLVTVLLLLSRRMGYNAMTAVAMSFGAAAVGAAFSPVNPFQVGIAQKLAGLPLLSGAGFRIVFLVFAVALWAAGTMRYAAKTRTEPEAENGAVAGNFTARKVTVLLIVIGTFAFFIFGVMRLGWDFNQMSALFFGMGIAVGLIGGLRISGTAEAFVEGFKSMAFAGLLIGFARGIFVVMNEGKIIDTIVHGMVSPLTHLPVALSAVGMMIMHTFVHFPVPSVSGQAVLTLPVLVPVSDLLGLQRQVAVLAYQYGAGLCELLTPTNGTLVAIIAAARVPYEDWLKFVFPLYLMLFALGAVSILVAIACGLH